MGIYDDNGHKGNEMTTYPIIILCSVENCPSAQPASEGEVEEAALKAFVTQEDGYFVIDCPELSIHVSDPNCHKAQRKLELAVMDYYQVLIDLPDKFMGEVQRYQLAFYEETLLPAISKYLAEKGELLADEPSLREFVHHKVANIRHWSPQVSKLVNC